MLSKKEDAEEVEQETKEEKKIQSNKHIWSD